MVKKSGNKSAQKSAGAAGGIPFRKGADSRRARGPARGAPNAGRPPHEFKEFFRRLLSTPKAEKELRAVLEDSPIAHMADRFRPSN